MLIEVENDFQHGKESILHVKKPEAETRTEQIWHDSMMAWWYYLNQAPGPINLSTKIPKNSALRIIGSGFELCETSGFNFGSPVSTSFETLMIVGEVNNRKIKKHVTIIVQAENKLEIAHDFVTKYIPPSWLLQYQWDGN